ncbi:MAG: AMP-binding protein, partial [Alphaproteobacteria bacterium]|nr:AMP-binding protein [Alphaproteobacteria bacterium]
MNIASWLARTGLTHGHLPAVALADRVVQDYRTLAVRAACLAAGLKDAGLAPGDRIALVSANHPAYVETLFGIWHGGFAAVPINAKLHASEITHILKRSGARACFAGPSLEIDKIDRLVTLGTTE